jgi:hypothetical protein
VCYNEFVRLKEIINGLLEKIGGIPEKAKGIFSVLDAWIKDAFERVGPDKRKPLLIGIVGLAALLLILAIAVGILNSKKRQKAPSAAAPGGLTISAEELFIPEEPDFLPEFIFEREKRRFWSIEDIRPYWKTPDPSDRWREEIKSAVDKLMEGIP